MADDNDEPSGAFAPYLFYSNAPAAIDFLCRAFGFEEQFRYPMPDGKIGHAELAHRKSLVMLASVWQEGGHSSPLDLPAVHSQVFCAVDDVDAHYERARDAGATIVTEPSDQHGMRLYRVIDLEGHRWVFTGPVAKPEKVDPE